MADDDRTLDAALSALSGVAATPPGDSDDDARWAKRVASRVSTFAPASRRELDTVLQAPFPDGHKDQDFPGSAHWAGPGYENVGPSAIQDDDHTAAALASDSSEAAGWEGSMSRDEEDDARPPPNSLAALSGLTRSGPASKAPDSFDGAAKGDDSGLINLAAMNKTDEPPPVEAAPAAAANETAPSSGKAAIAPAPISSKKIPIASTASANAPASSTAATAAAAAPAAPATKKGSGMILWLGLGGVAAAAAAAFVLVGPMARKADETASNAAPPPAAVEAKKSDKPTDEKVAAAEPAPQASATAPEGNADQVAGGPHAPKPMATAPSKAGSGYDPKGISVAPGTPTPTATATAKPTADPAKPAGSGSLDDVLGIGKDQPTTKKTDPSDNLPDKPESMDVRSAINAKVSAASGCVKGLDGPSNVSITFGPGGGVAGVVVTSGPAKGTGAESCIKNAFSSAKVTASKKGATGSATLVP
jgi:hypothetical protein